MLRWGIVGAVVLFGGFALLAIKMSVPKGMDEYEIAVTHLRTMYAGPTTFDVSAFDNPHTWIAKSQDRYVLHGVMRSDHHDVVPVAKQSPAGEVRFAVTIFTSKLEGRWPLNGMVYVYGDIVLEPVK